MSTSVCKDPLSFGNCHETIEEGNRMSVAEHGNEKLEGPLIVDEQGD